MFQVVQCFPMFDQLCCVVFSIFWFSWCLCGCFTEYVLGGFELFLVVLRCLW